MDETSVTEQTSESEAQGPLGALPDEIFMRMLGHLDFKSQKALALASSGIRARVFTATPAGISSVAALRQSFREFVDSLFPEVVRKRADYQASFKKLMNIEIDAFFRRGNIDLFRQRVEQLIPVLSRRNPDHQPALDISNISHFPF